MKTDKILRTGSLIIPGQKYYDTNHRIYHPSGIAPTLPAAMGMGGGLCATTNRD